MEENFKRALFINYGGLGDEILFLPCLKSFKEKYKDCKITLCLESRAKGIKQLTSLIDEVIEVEIKAAGLKKYFNILGLIKKAREGKFDVVISSGKSPFVALILYLTGIKRRSGYFSKTAFLLTDGVELNENQYAGNMYHDLILPYLEDDEIEDRIKLPVVEAGNFEIEEGFVALHPGVSLMSINKGIFKCPEVAFWHEVIKGTLNKGKKLVLLGGPDDKEIVEKIVSDKEIAENPNFINMFGKTKNLKDLASIIAKSRKFICADSAPLHIAIGLNKEVITVFGPTNENKLVPQIENVKVVTNDVECRPCLWHKRMVNCEASDCLKIDPCKVIDLV